MSVKNIIRPKMLSLLGLIAAIVVLILLVGCQGDSKGSNVQNTGPQNQATTTDKKLFVYIPCGMREPFDYAIKAFNEEYSKDHPGLPVATYYDNSVILVRKIQDGDRPDILISPGVTELGELVTDGTIDADSVRNFGTYTMALVVPRGNPANIKSLDDLLRDDVKSIAIGDPKHTSVGHYAKQVLEYYGLYEKLQNKMVSPEHSLDVITYAVMKKVDASLAYETCPLQSAPEKASKEKVEIVFKIDDKSHDPILVQAGILKESVDPKRAAEFIEFLQSDDVQKAFAERGLPNLPKSE